MSIPIDAGRFTPASPADIEPHRESSAATAAPSYQNAHGYSFASTFGRSALPSLARGPCCDPNLTVDDPAVTRPTDQALGELKKAQQAKAEADQGGNARHIDEAQMSLKQAQDKLKRAVQNEGAVSVLARHPNDPAATTAVRAAELAIAQDRLAQVEAKIPNLHQMPADALDSRIQPPALYRELVAARKDVGSKTDALEREVNGQALSMRAQGMSREDALAQLRAHGYVNVIGTGGEQPANGRMPSTIGMTEKERSDLYVPNFQRNASPQAWNAFNDRKPVIFAIRHDTPLQANGERGAYDDRYVVLQKRADGTVRVQEFDGSQDPNTQYGNGQRDTHDVPWSQRPDKIGPYAEGGSTGSLRGTPIEAYSRVADGTIELTTGPTLDHLYPKDGNYSIEGDINGDGVFNDGYSRKAYTNAFQLHPGKETYAHTGSAGCLTVPPHQWSAFKQAVGVLDADSPGNSIYYVQTGENKLRY